MTNMKLPPFLRRHERAAEGSPLGVPSKGASLAQRPPATQTQAAFTKEAQRV